MSRYTLNDLRYLMDRLRDPDTGCQWDIKQNANSIAHLTIEEAYEVVEAIDQNDWSSLKGELGDLLFHVIFYSKLADEQGKFTLDDVINEGVSKLVRRHPHVFPDGLYSKHEGDRPSESAVASQWEAIKSEERQRAGDNGLLDNIPLALPAMVRALKLQKRAASVGFDWSSTRDVLACVRRELDELEAALDDPIAAKDELGDVLFSVVNMSRHLTLNPESALRFANQKFTERIKYIDAQCEGDWHTKSVDDLERLWNEAKALEKMG